MAKILRLVIKHQSNNSTEEVGDFLQDSFRILLQTSIPNLDLAIAVSYQHMLFNQLNKKNKKHLPYLRDIANTSF